jgi:23S rRNA (guanosine2251-2'-O)-methyltransferase
LYCNTALLKSLKMRQRDKNFKRPLGPKPQVSARAQTAFVGGRNAVRQLILNAPGRIIAVKVSDKAADMDKTGRELLGLLDAKKIQVQMVRFDELSKLARHHQGFVAEVIPNTPLDLAQLEELGFAADDAVILALDGVQDPQNLGSILRAADSFGAACTVWSKNRSAPITDAVNTVSAGALQFAPHAVVSNLRDALLRLRKAGFQIVATMISDTAVDAYQHSFDRKTVIVLGGESDGVQQLIAKEADAQLYLSQYGVVDSLNVGQAAAVFLSMYRMQRGG